MLLDFIYFNSIFYLLWLFVVSVRFYSIFFVVVVRRVICLCVVYYCVNYVLCGEWFVCVCIVVFVVCVLLWC